MEKSIIFLLGPVVAVLTFYISIEKQQGGVRASALIALLTGGFTYFFPEVLSDYLTKNVPLVSIGSSFIGMVSTVRLTSYKGLVVAGSLFSVLYLYSSNFFQGYGGVLGTAACISLLSVLAVPYLSNKR